VSCRGSSLAYISAFNEHLIQDERAPLTLAKSKYSFTTFVNEEYNHILPTRSMDCKRDDLPPKLKCRVIEGS